MTESSDHEIERRQHFRLDMEKELVDIFWLDEQGEERRKKVACRDFSRGGLRIDSDIEMAEDLAVIVTFKVNTVGSQSLKGKVLRCTPQQNGWYEIAFQLETKA